MSREIDVEDIHHKRSAFFGKMGVVLGVVAILSLYISYDRLATHAWLAEFDPIVLDIKIAGMKLLSISYPSGVGIGFYLEATLVLIGVLILYFVVGLQFSDHSTRIARRKVYSILDDWGQDFAIPIERRSQHSLANSDAPQKFFEVPRFLWGKDWQWWVAGLFVLVAWINLIEGPDTLNGFQDDECYPRVKLWSSPVESVLPSDLNKRIELNEFQACSITGKEKEINRVHRSTLVAWMSQKKNIWPASDRESQLAPYAVYFIHSVINYIFIILTIILHSGSFMITTSRDLKSVTLKIREKVINSTPQDSLHVYDQIRTPLSQYFRGFLNPAGWLALALFLVGWYEWWFGAISLSDLARWGVLMTFGAAIAVVFIADKTASDIEPLANLFKMQADKADDEKTKSELITAFNELRPENLMAERENVFVWRFIGGLRKFVVRLLPKNP